MQTIYRIFLFSLSLVLATATANAQVFTGGNVGVSYDNGIYADIAPVVGYRLDAFNGGVSPLFSYKKPDNSTQQFFSIGARAFGQYHLIENAFLHAEFQTLNAQTTSVFADGTRIHDRVWTISFPVGAGYETRLNDKTRVQASVLYDLLQKKNNPNNMPVIRGGIIYDL